MHTGKPPARLLALMCFPHAEDAAIRAKGWVARPGQTVFENSEADDPGPGAVAVAGKGQPPPAACRPAWRPKKLESPSDRPEL